MRGLIVMTLIFLAFVGARFFVFAEVFGKGARQPTPDLYRKPVMMRQLILPAAGIPPGYTGGGASAAQILKGAALPASEALAAHLPRPRLISELLVESFTSSLGHKVVLRTARYPDSRQLSQALTDPPRDRERRIPVRIAPPRYHLTDHFLTWIEADDDDVARFAHAVEENIRVQKKRREDVEKLSVAGNAYLKFFADILVGAFGFVLVLFFLKYFLVMRQVEQ
jgi:hypothetical protein